LAGDYFRVAWPGSFQTLNWTDTVKKSKLYIKMNFRYYFWGSIILCLFGTGCSKYLHQPFNAQEARIGETTQFTRALIDLPKPDNPLVAAVYKFRDQTGQYRPQENGSGFSTAVTQGATNILIKAMDDSGWFETIERENVGNLLNERKIIRSGRIQYEGIEGPGVPPLLFAGVILEGGIVSYDANTVTGGFGARYFGLGGDGQYRQDRVTVYLRAVATNNGKILETVYTSKTILSQALNGGLFRFVSFRRILEAETGYTYNEPSDIAVREAIEKAVYALIMEGIKDGYWGVSEEKAGAQQQLINDYEAEKAMMEETNMFGRTLFQKPVGFSVGVNGNAHYYQGDLPEGDLNIGGGIGFEYFFNPSIGVSLSGGLSSLTASNLYTERVGYGEGNLIWRLLPFDRFSPIAYGGMGLVIDQESEETSQRNQYGKFQIGGGFEFFINKSVAFQLSVDYNYLMNDAIDDINEGRYNDIYYRGQLGIKYFFGNDFGSSKNDPTSGSETGN